MAEAGFHFAQPWWLLALLALVPIALWLLFTIQRAHGIPLLMSAARCGISQTSVAGIVKASFAMEGKSSCCRTRSGSADQRARCILVTRTARQSTSVSDDQELW